MLVSELRPHTSLLFQRILPHGHPNTLYKYRIKLVAEITASLSKKEAMYMVGLGIAHGMRSVDALMVKFRNGTYLTNGKLQIDSGQIFHCLATRPT